MGRKAIAAASTAPHAAVLSQRSHISTQSNSNLFYLTE
jgi:hypothetical protein